MIRMCDTTQTWKWGGFGPGRVGGGGGGEGEDSGRQTRCRRLRSPRSRASGGTGVAWSPPGGERRAEAVMVARLRPPLPG